MTARTDNDDDRRVCDQCGQLMKLARVVPKFGGNSALRSYRCPVCEHVVTVEGKPATFANKFY